MSVRLVNTTASEIRFPDIPFYKVPAGIGQAANFPASAIQNSAHAQDAIAAGTVSVDGTIVTPEEAAAIGLPMTEVVALLAAGPSAGQKDYVLRYPTGAAPGSPAVRTTYTYGNVTYPTIATAIVQTADVVP